MDKALLLWGIDYMFIYVWSISAGRFQDWELRMAFDAFWCAAIR